MSQTTDRYRTGIAPLDRELGGGIPAGSIVALTAPPASQSELLLYGMAAEQQTLYLTAERTTLSVRTAIEDSGCDLTRVNVHAVDRDTPLTDALEYVRRFDSASVVVVDPMDVIERRDPAQLREFLVTLRGRLLETGSVAVLHCLDGGDVPEQRDRTLYMADAVFDLRTRVDGERVENRLSVPKFRGGPALTEAMRLELTERVVVDTSRDIA
ncbi:transcriptional regulator [Halomicroarcula limicola]|uniref:Transcriptional regulator n=1 Tax=Haloarcula limicola TaxID=1429915 RepID=A0A8J7Y610_9EURY|nr:ATPase domain-containing protein [Halomicroarcula limicola]MBV0924917.1 transcriptional regulator [Halomicroarcula limicola]